MKRSAPIRRGKPPARKTPIRKQNRKRKASEFQRCYGSKARVAFVKSLPCVVRSSAGLPGAYHLGEIQNAHIGRRAGMALKGPFTEIVPMCGRHHHILHEGRESFLAAYDLTDERLMAYARHTQTLWQSHQGAPA